LAKLAALVKQNGRAFDQKRGGLVQKKQKTGG